MKTKKASSQSPSPAQKKQKTSQGTEVRVDNKAKGTPFEYDPNNPLVSLPPDALTAVLCRSPSSDHDALWRSCKTIRSTLNSAAFTSERVATGYAEVSVRHITKEELWYNAYGMDEEHDPASEEHDAEESARRKEEEMTGMSELGYCDESYGYHDIKFEVMVDGRCRGSINLVLFPYRGRLFLEAADAHSQELQEVAYTLCDMKGRPKFDSIKEADSDRTAERGGFLHVMSIRVSQACRQSENTDVPSKALRMAITHSKLQGKWTLATGIADARVYFMKTDEKLKMWQHSRISDTLTVEEEATEKERSRRWDKCMYLDSKTFLRVGYQQIPEVLLLMGAGNQANWFFALPRFLNDAILSDAEASEVGLVKGPELPLEPKGVNRKLLDLVVPACKSRRYELNAMNRTKLLLAEKMDQLGTYISSSRRRVEEKEEELRNDMSQIEEHLQPHRAAAREHITELEKQRELVEAEIKVSEEQKKEINEMETELNEKLSKGKADIETTTAELDAKNREKDVNFVQQVKSLIEDDGASIRKAFVLHCVSRFRLNDLFDALLDRVPADERKAAINEIDFSGGTPLSTAAQSVPDNIGQANEQYEFCSKLMKLGADKNRVDFRGLTALGIYRTTVRPNRESRVMMVDNPFFNSIEAGDWEPIYERMEDLLMPAGGETEADRKAKQSPESDDDWDEDEEDSEEEDDILDEEEGGIADGEDDEGLDGED